MRAQEAEVKRRSAAEQKQSCHFAGPGGVDRPIGRFPVVDELKGGLPAKALDTFKQSAHLSDEQVAELLQIGGRTLSRARAVSRRRLSPDLSERLFAVASVYALGIGVFGDTQTAFGWIN